MRKIFLAISGLVIFSLVLGFPISVMAATVTFNVDTTLSLPNGVTLKVSGDSLAEQVVVNNVSTVTITLAADSNITIRSQDRYSLNVATDSGSPTVSYSCSTTSNTATLTAGAAAVATLTVDTTATCGSGHTVTPPSAGGGGGGGGALTVTPTNTSVAINSNDAQTESTSVTLTLAATNATQMLISNNSSFSDVTSWLSYATSKTWTLLSGVGTKTVYVKFRSSSGGDSAAVSDTIELVAPTEAVSGEVSGSAGGSASLSDNKASVSIPAGAVSGSGTVSITPTTSYTDPGGSKTVVGSKAYEFSITAGGQEVTTFSDFVTLTFTYTDNDIAGLDESTLSIYYWSESTSAWLNLGGTVNAASNTITVNTAHFTKFAVFGEASAASGSLVKLACAANAGVNDPCKAVYYLGNNGKRYVFPNEKTYKTWYDDFSTVTTISADSLASYMIGGNVTYRPGIKLVKIQTDPKVYAVDKNGTLRWMSTAAIAESLYGANWSSQIDDIPDAFFVNYKTGSNITAASDYDKAAAKSNSPDINTDKGL